MSESFVLSSLKVRYSKPLIPNKFIFNLTFIHEKGLVFFITGGDSGLGAGCVRRFLSHECKVVAFDLKDSSNHAPNENLLFITGDVTSEEDVAAAFEKAALTFGAVHVLINCAGIILNHKTYDPNSIDSSDMEIFRRIINVNVLGSYTAIRQATAQMAKNKADSLLNANRCSDEDAGILARGVIINTSSTAALDGLSTSAAYSASKGAILSMTLPLARELAPVGIRVVAIAPGICETPMVIEGDVRAVIDRVCPAIPFPQRLIKPDEFAHLVETIVVNPMINGEFIRLDGGLRAAV